MQSIPTVGASALEVMTIGETTQLFISNAYSASEAPQESKFYRWSDGQFVETQTILTKRAGNPAAFQIQGDTYIVVPSARDAATNAWTGVYRWNGARFVKIQNLQLFAARHATHFSADGDDFLVLAGSSTENGLPDVAVVYRWTGLEFTPVQQLATQGGYSSHAFRAGGMQFLALPNAYDGQSSFLDTNIYQWNGSAFALHQRLATEGAGGVDTLEMSGELYLAIASFKYGNPGDALGDYRTQSRVYRFSDGSFVETQALSTRGAIAAKAITLDARPVLAMLNHFDGRTGLLNAVLYR